MLSGTSDTLPVQYSTPSPERFWPVSAADMLFIFLALCFFKNARCSFYFNVCFDVVPLARRCFSYRSLLTPRPPKL